MNQSQRIISDLFAQELQQMRKRAELLQVHFAWVEEHTVQGRHNVGQIHEHVTQMREHVARIQEHVARMRN